jgi:CDP-diacylglycerol--glycerol-3-phosphate 3-phosphatidyltransferase
MLFAHTVAVDLPQEPRSPNHANAQALDRLRRRWLWTALLYALCLAGGYWFLATAWQPAPAGRWLFWAGLATVVELGVLWWVLPQNHPPASATLLPTFGYGTALTLFCGLMLALLAGFLFAPQPPGLLAWLPALIYTVARLVDYVDGYVARITRHETKLGSTLDMEFDGLGVLIAILLCIQYGKIPLWYLPLALSRQLFIAGIWWRTRRGKPVYEMTPSGNRRITAGFQTAFVSVMLWPIFTPPLTTLAAVVFALPLLASFGRDWLVVSGVLDPASPGYQRGLALIKSVIEGWLPLLCRVLGTVMAVLVLLHDELGLDGWAEATAAAWPAAPEWLLQAVMLLAWAALPCFLLGILGRVAAVPLIALAMLDITAFGLRWTDNGLLFITAVVVAHAGSGRLAIWRPEEAILNKRPGERPSQENAVAA